MGARSRLGWWSISGEDLLELLHRAAATGDAEVVYMEAYANAEVEDAEAGRET